MISLAQLNQLIAEHACKRRTASEVLRLTPAAFFDGSLSVGRVLSEPVYAALDFPLADQSAMDGYALPAGAQLSAGSVFEVIGEVSAGGSPKVAVGATEAVRIYTGAWLPAGCDTVVIQELVKRVDTPLGAQITLTQDARPQQHVRCQSEEFAYGDSIFAAGHVLSAFDLGLLAQLGLTQVSLHKKPVITLLASGDELVPVGTPLASAQLHNTNSLLIGALLSRLPVVLIDGGIIADTLEDCTEALLQAASSSDVVITSGGVSAGDKDYFARALEQVGQSYQHKVAMKPGKPVLFGEIQASLASSGEVQTSHSALYFGLPGNPVSSGITALKILIPALKILCGETTADESTNPPAAELSAVLSSPINHRAGRLEFVRGVLSRTTHGFSVRPLAQGSHRIKNMAAANCLIVVPRHSENLDAGAKVTVQLL